MYTSQHQNHDPYPFQTRWNDGGRKGRYAHDVSEWTEGMGTCQHEPRPEFDNTPNPLLVAYREIHDGDMRGWGAWLFLASELSVEKLDDDAHYQHARKVLRKLAAQQVLAEGGDR